MTADLLTVVSNGNTEIALPTNSVSTAIVVDSAVLDTAGVSDPNVSTLRPELKDVVNIFVVSGRLSEVNLEQIARVQQSKYFVRCSVMSHDLLS